MDDVRATAGREPPRADGGGSEFGGVAEAIEHIGDSKPERDPIPPPKNLIFSEGRITDSNSKVDLTGACYSEVAGEDM